MWFGSGFCASDLVFEPRESEMSLEDTVGASVSRE